MLDKHEVPSSNLGWPTIISGSHLREGRFLLVDNSALARRLRDGIGRAEAERNVMRFTLADALEAAERIVRGEPRDTLATEQQRAMREDSIPNLVRDMLAETILSIVRKLRRQAPPD